MRQGIITSRSNPVIKRLLSLESPHARRKTGTFLIEGPKFIHDALTAGAEIVTLVVSERYSEEMPRPGPDVKFLRVSSKLLKNLSDTASPQGLIAEAKRRWLKLGELVSSGKHLLIAWGVQDPGNVGTMVRSSEAFGLGGSILGAESADPFSPKSVRASAGTVLYHPLAAVKALSELVGKLRGSGYATHWTGAKAKTHLREVPRGQLLAVFIGSEGGGFTEKDREIIGAGLRIHTRREVDSLNAGVAGSIVAYELAARSGYICS